MVGAGAHGLLRWPRSHWQLTAAGRWGVFVLRGIVTAELSVLLTHTVWITLLNHCGYKTKTRRYDHEVPVGKRTVGDRKGIRDGVRASVTRMYYIHT